VSTLLSFARRPFAPLLLGLIVLTACQSTSTATPSPNATASSPASPTPSVAPTATRSAVAAHWEVAAALTTVRTLSDAALLDDGRVLAVGNASAEFGAEARPIVAESWTQATGTWQAVEPLGNPRSSFALVPLRDGRALVAGGANATDQSYSSAYVLDPGATSGTWSKVGLLGAARTAPTAAVLSDGRVLVAGGFYRTGPTTGAAFRPEIVAAAHRPDSPTTAPLSDADVPPDGRALATAELFDPATGTWTSTGPMNFARVGAAAVTLSDGRVLVVGSAAVNVRALHHRAFESTEIYDPKSGRFSLAGALPSFNREAVKKLGVSLPLSEPMPAYTGTLVALRDGGALLVGHSRWWKHQGEITRSFRFDPRTRTWVEAEPACAWVEDNQAGTSVHTPGTCRVRATVATLQDGRVLIAGGVGGYQNSTPAMRSARLYDPSTNAWSPLPDMPGPRGGGVALLLRDGSVLVLGGSVDERVEESIEQKQLSSVFRFVPSR
jgi:Kelch motif protein/galactose oxidase-like protein